MKYSVHIRSVMIVSFLLIFITLLNGCSEKSETEALEETIEISKRTFQSKEIMAPNHHSGTFSIYIPNQLHVENEEDRNIILNDGKQTYIVFNNSFEEPTSKLGYQAAANKQALVLESFQADNKFGYIQIMHEVEDSYEMQVGIGGTKITTFTNKNKMIKDAAELMKMALSTIEATSEAANEE